MSRKRLTPEDRAAWDRVARQTIPNPGRAEHLPKALKPRSKADGIPSPSPSPSPAPSLPAFRIGEKASPRATTAAVAQQPAPTMDARAFRRLTRGKTRPDARIDLHGMTLARARPALIDFVQTAHRRGHRLLLVITGKGRAEEAVPFEGRGVLRRQVPIWLRSAPLAPLILETRSAHIRHGGAGALYVYLRRVR